MTRIKPKPALIILAIILGGALWAISLFYRAHLLALEREYVYSELVNHSFLLTRALENKIATLYSLKAFIESQQSEQHLNENINQYLAKLSANLKGIRVISVAPNGINRYVYPLFGNELLLGKNLFSDSPSELRADALRALRSRKVVISGPFEDWNGGFGIIGILAIFRNERFWGFVTIGVDITNLLEEAQFGEANHPNYYAFRRHTGKVFAGNPLVFDKNPVISKIELPGGYWELAGIPRAGWNALVFKRVWIMRGLSLVFLLLSFSYLYFLLTQRTQLERLVAQRTLEVSRIATQLQMITDGISGIIAYVDRNVRYQFVNKTYETWYGLTKNDMLGKSMREVWKPEVYSRIEPYIQQVLSGIPAHYDSTIELKIGKREISIDYIPHFGETGEVIGFFILGVDMTERKLAEEKLRTAEQQLQFFLSSSPAVIYAEQFEQGIARNAFISDNLLDIFGYTSQEYYREREFWKSRIHPDDYPLVEQKYNRFLDQGIFRCEYRFRHKNGSYRWVYDEARIIRDHSGTPSQIIGFLNDITDRKTAEEKAKSTQERLKYLVSEAPVVIYSYSVGEERQVTFVSENVIDLLGYAAGEFIIEPDFWRNRVHSEDYPQVRHELANLLSTGHIVLEYRFQHENGTYRWLRDEARVIKDNQGNPVEVIGYWIDITAEKQAKEELDRSFGKLRRAMAGTIRALASATELRDPYTAGHQRRVANLARAIATEMNLPSDTIEGIRIAATVHDIGKIYIPAEILTKPTQLTALEFELIKTHPQGAYDILKEIEFPWPVAQAVYQHHERLNGSGYPNKLTSDQIVLEAKIIAVADVVEAMTTHRPYRPALGIETALDEIKRNSGILYAPEVVRACITVFEKGFIFD
ncbi:MAG: PAS domain-containing protein [bacterium]|nr:PAS domain-containing protein [bacterium]